MIAFKRQIGSPKNAWPNNPAAIYENFRKDPLCIGVSWVIAAQDMVSRIKSSRIEYSADAVTNKDSNVSFELSYCKS